jgi:hypothetical protein
MLSSARTVPKPSEIADVDRPPYLWALGVGLLVFALYAVTLAPTTQFWDTSEYIATAHILGIPHPPGNPLFVLLARTWDILLSPLHLSTAVRINLFSAFMSASAHSLWFLVVHHVLRHFGDKRSFRLAGAFVAVLLSATAFTVWNQSNVNEKVYTVSLATIALLSWLLFRWEEKLGQGKDDNLIILMVFILALSVGNHLMAFLAAPAILVFVLVVHPQTLLNWKLYVAGLIAGVLGLSVHLFLPLRAGLGPLINEADPTCETFGSAVVSIISWGKTGCVALSDALSRRQYDKPPLLPRLAPLSSQLTNYLQYFDWQWSRSLAGSNVLLAPVRIPFTMAFTALGLWGAMEHRKRDRPSFLYVLALFSTLSIGLVWYLNFKYGYSIVSSGNQPGAHEVRERDYFFIVSFSVWGLWAGLGIVVLWQQVAGRMGSLVKAAPVLAIAFVPLALNWPWATRSYDWSSRDWGYNLLMSVEPYGVLFTNGDNDTFPLWYAQEVEGVRKDVTVIVTSYLNTAWYARQLRDLTTPCSSGQSPDQDPTRIICQRPYDASARAIYTMAPDQLTKDQVALPIEHPILPPDRPIFDLDNAAIEEVMSSYIMMDEAQSVVVGDIQAVLPAGGYLYPWHQLGLTIIHQSIASRPIYFASSGNAAGELGVQPYLVRQGLAFKLNNGELDAEAPDGPVAIIDTPIRAVTGPWIDVPRTEILMEEVFVNRSDLPNWDHWPDRSTLGIPSYYSWGYYALAQAAAQANDNVRLAKFREMGDGWSMLAGR